jgi:hypothetical protein
MIYYVVPQYPLSTIDFRYSAYIYNYMAGDIYGGAQRTGRVSVEWTGIR